MVDRVIATNDSYRRVALARGRVPGAVVGTVDDALTYLKELERANREK